MAIEVTLRWVPLGGTLDPDNRWVVFSTLMPWEELEETYTSQFSPTTGAPAKSLRLAFGVLFIKQRLGLTDEETVEQIRENAYMQFVLGFTGYSSKATTSYPGKDLLPIDQGITLNVSFGKGFAAQPLWRTLGLMFMPYSWIILIIPGLYGIYVFKAWGKFQREKSDQPIVVSYAPPKDLAAALAGTVTKSRELVPLVSKKLANLQDRINKQLFKSGYCKSKNLMQLRTKSYNNMPSFIGWTIFTLENAAFSGFIDILGCFLLSCRLMSTLSHFLSF
jgi:hypothetical protein